MTEENNNDSANADLSASIKKMIEIYQAQKQNEKEKIEQAKNTADDGNDDVKTNEWKLHNPQNELDDKADTLASLITPKKQGDFEETSDKKKKEKEVFLYKKSATGNERNKRKIKQRTKDLLIIGIMLSTVAYIEVYIAHIIAAIWAMDTSLLCYPDILLLLLVVNAANFIFASTCPNWSYYNRKKSFILIHTLLIGLGALAPMMWGEIEFVAPNVALLKTTSLFKETLTETAIDSVVAIFTILPACLLALALMLNIARYLQNKQIFRKLCAFRLLMHSDLRHNKRYLYDSHIIKYQKNGKAFVMREEDRYLHSLVVGASGTAKTSSVILPAVKEILITRCRNQEKIKKLMWEGLVKGYFELVGPLTNEGFNINAFVATKPEAEKLLQKIKKEYRMSGMFVLGPDPSLSDKVYELCKKYNISCNRIDPTPDNWATGEPKDGSVGFNLLYIPSDTPEWRRPVVILQRAILVADVMQEIYLMNGKEEKFFTSVNRSITVAVTICLCATFKKLEKRHPNLKDVQEIIDDFSRIRKYYERLKQINDKDQRNLYGPTLDLIKNDMLGEGAKKMTELSMGLRRIFDEVLTDPMISGALCPSDDKTLDMDKVLAEGQITAVNFAQSLGAVSAKWFGLILLLSFFKAVLRRDGAQGTMEVPHFLIVDELPVILTPEINTAISLFRKYRVSFLGAMQSLNQLDVDEKTRPLKKTLLSGCAFHILFGRQGIEEMRDYCILSGRELIIDDIESVMTSRSSKDGLKVTSTTVETPQYEDRLSADDIRYRDFQEVTCYPVRDSVLMVPFIGRCEFLADEKNPVKIMLYNWDKYFDPIRAKKVTEDDDEEEDFAGVSI